MIIRTLRDGELGAWAAHCQQVFFDIEDGYFRRHYELDPDADPSLVFIAEDEGRIVSTVRVFRRKVRIGGRVYSMGGIGEVSTQPEYRRKGLASQLLDQAIEAMRREGMAVSLLFGDRPIYSKAGYRFVEASRTLAQVASLPALPKNGTIRPYQTEDLPLIMGIYDAYAGQVDGALVRSPEYWTRWVLPQWGDVWVLEMENRPVAYCVMQGSGELNEIGAAPQYEEYLPALVGAAARAGGADTLRFMTDLMPQIPGERDRIPLYMALDLTEIEPILRPGFFPVDHF